MKKTLTILLLACISLFVQAQKCKFDYQKKDAFTGKLSSGITATLARAWKIGFMKLGDDYTIGLFLNFAGSKEDAIFKGDTLMFALDNENPIIFTATENSLPTSDVVVDKIQTWYRPIYKADIEQMQKLATAKIIAVKIYVGNWYSFDLPQTNAQKIIQSVNCILNQ